MKQAGAPAPFLILLSYAAIYIVWGSTYLFIGLAVQTIPPSLVIAMRFLLAGCLFLVVAFLGKSRPTRPTGKQILSAMLLGLLFFVLGNGLVTYAETTVPSHLAALIISCTPFLVAFFNKIVFKKPIPVWGMVGAIIGLVGVGLLLLGGTGSHLSLNPALLLVLAAAISWAIATAGSHRLPQHPNLMVHTAMQMIFGGIVALILTLITNPNIPGILANASLLSLGSTLFLALVGGASILAFNFLLKHEPAFRISSYSLVNPVIATMLGLILNKETSAPLLVWALPLLLIGLALILWAPKKA